LLNKFWVQLNQLKWSDFVNNPNPLATALMARMKIRKCDRPHVKLQCLRLLATLSLDADKSQLISHFVNSYLRLNPLEMRIYEDDVETIPLVERQAVMQYTNEWTEKGRQEGLHEGRQEGIRASLALWLERRFGERAAALLARLPGCDLATIHRLQEQLIDGADLELLEKFLPD